jgi:hypothetical protein
MATEHGSRSETDRLRDVFLSVEDALQSGVSRKAVLEALHQDGFTMSLKMFDKALYRIRKSNKISPIELGSNLQTPDRETGQTVPTMPTVKKVAQPERKPVTRAELRKLRNEEEDWEALNEG